jgi:hypothetical protein
MGKTWVNLPTKVGKLRQFLLECTQILHDLPTPKMPKNRIEVRLVFQGADDDPKVIVGKWLQDNKPFAIEALTMLCQVRELIVSGGYTPERIKLAMLESTHYLQSRLQLVEQLGTLNGDSAEVSESINHHRPASHNEIEIEL